MTKELKIKDAVKDDNPITKTVFDEKTESVFYCCYNLEHDNETVVLFLTTSSGNTFVSSNSHFNVASETLVIQVSGIHEMHNKDGYKGRPDDFVLIIIGSSKEPFHNFIDIEKTDQKWVDINIFNYPPATPHSHDTTDKRDSESVWASLMRKQGAPEGLRKASKQSQRSPNKICCKGERGARREDEVLEGETET